MPKSGRMILFAAMTLITSGVVSASASDTETPQRAAVEADGPVEVTRWPDRDTFARFYPPAALAQGIAGRATLRCTVDETGALSGCVVLEERPTGWGFGRAALQMANAFRVRPPQSGARAQVVFPIRFAPGAIAASPESLVVTPVSPNADRPSP